VSWLPLYHDLGLIGANFASLVLGFPTVLMSPLAFLSRPASWMRAIHRHRGTMSGGPNFSFELCLRRIADEDMEGIDLSSWRFAFNAASRSVRTPSSNSRSASRNGGCAGTACRLLWPGGVLRGRGDTVPARPGARID
jgi:acyl-CoA synthetase (AMP-forming)/AMP-acid ligase II